LAQFFNRTRIIRLSFIYLVAEGIVKEDGACFFDEERFKLFKPFKTFKSSNGKDFSARR